VKKYFLSFSALFVLFSSTYGQKIFSISTDLALDFWDEKNIGIEYQINNNFSVGGIFSVIYPNQKLALNELSAVQENWPGTIYTGYAGRAYFKWYPNSGHTFTGITIKGYWSIQFDLKYMQYGTQWFVDQYDDQGAPGYHWTLANAKTRVLDIDFFHGQEIYLGKVVLIDLIYGIGLRQRNVDQNIIESVSNDTYTAPPNLSYGPGMPYGTTGTVHLSYLYPFPEIGIREGIAIPSK